MSERRTCVRVCTLVIVIWSLAIILFITNNKHLQYNNIVGLVDPMEINSYFILSFLLSSFKKKKAKRERERKGVGWKGVGKVEKQSEEKNKQIFSLCISFGNRLVFLNIYVLYIYLDFCAAVAVAAAVVFLERYSNIEPLTLRFSFSLPH